MRAKSKIGTLVLVTLLLTSLSVALVAAQYTTQKTTNVLIDSNGQFTAQEPSVGIAYSIAGAVAATGSVTASIYDGDPQSSAIIPSGVTLSHFVVITFNMLAHDFSSATITITYNDADVQNLNAPYTVYKWDANSNTYIPLSTNVDISAKTMTVILSSINDPLLAIGGATKGTSTSGGGSGGISTLTWGIVIAAIVIIILVAIFTVSILRKPDQPKTFQNKSSFKIKNVN